MLQLLFKMGWSIPIWKDKLKTELCIATCKLFLLTCAEFFNILAIGQKYFSIYPPFLFIIKHRVIIYQIFLDKYFSSWLCRIIYKLGQQFFIYHLWYSSNLETTYKKPPFIHQGSYFFVMWFYYQIIMVAKEKQ